MRGTSKKLYRIGRRAVLAAAGSTLAFPVVVRAQRKGGVTVADVGQLVAKLRNEAKVIA